MLLHYQKHGKGKPVVFIHGFLENKNMWSGLISELHEDHQIITVDLAGHGKSKVFKEMHSMEFQAKKVMEVLDAEKIEKATIIGHSMGGYITMAIADLFTERVHAFCLFYSTSLADTEEKKEQRLRTVDTVEKNRLHFIQKTIPNYFRKDKKNELKVEIEKAISWAQDTPTKGITAALLGMRERPDRTYILNQLELPISIILGEYDLAIDSDTFKKVIPEKKTIQIHSLPTGHMGHLEAPEQTKELIQSFLNKYS